MRITPRASHDRRRLGVIATAGFAALAAIALVATPAAADPSSSPSAAVSAAPSTSSTDSGVVPGSKTFTIGYLSDMDSANPYSGQLSLSYEIYSDVYDLLEGWSQKDYSPVPGLASSWTHTDDGKTWTFTIRSGVKWSDGAPLTASDVAYSINRAIKDPNGTYYNYVKNIDNVEATDATTAVFHLTAPDAIMTQLWVPIIPEHIWKDVSVDDSSTFQNTAMIGSGAFTMDKWVKGQYIRLKANKDYWGGAPKIDYLVYRIFNDDDAMIQALTKGDIDAVYDINANDYNSLAGAKGITRLKSVGSSFQYLAYNMGGSTVDNKPVGDGIPAMKDIKFRQAMSYALNLPLLTQKVLQGYGDVGASVIPSGYTNWTYHPGTAAYQYDPAKAAQMLDAAGYTKDANGLRIDKATGKEMNLNLLAPNDDPDYKNSVAYIVAWFKDVDIKVTPKLVSYDEVINEAGNAEYDLTFGDWSVEADPSFQLSTMTCDQRDTGTPKAPVGGWSDSFYCNKAYDALYAQQAAQLDPTARAATVQQMQQLLYTDMPYVVLYYPDELEAYNSAKWTGVQLQQGDAFFQAGTYTYRNLDIRKNAPKPAGTNMTVVYGGIGLVVVVIVVAGVVMLRRRSSADERE
jgi:peptide/nickel transport system substrate-binding protein